MLTTQRIFWPQFDTPEKLERLLAFLKNYRPLVQEISFFTEGDGLDLRYVPLDEVARRAEILRAAVPRAREEGFIPVINILNTLVHSDEGGPGAPVIPWQGIVSPSGAVARQCSCPANEEFLAYARAKYFTYGQAGADRYWMDDDVRMNNHVPVDWGCFCPSCVADMSQRAGRTFDRPGLVAALLADRSIRQIWVERSCEVMTRIFSTCAEGVRAANPTAEIGYMTCDLTEHVSAGIDLAKWLAPLAGGTSQRAWVRPGGGFWSDHEPRAILGKAHSVAQTASAVPPGTGVTYEMENYPYQLGAKSASMTGLECLITTLAGHLDGIMFNILDLAGNDPATYAAYFSSLSEWQPLWEKAAALTEGTVPVGWRSIYSPQHFVQHISERSFHDLREVEYQKPCALFPTGVPLTAFRQGALGHLLAGPASRGMSREELIALLDQPLILDGEAAQRYLDLGLGDRIGLHGIQPYSEGVYEVFSDDPVNQNLSGFRRSATLKYFGLTSYALQLAEGTRSLSTLCSYEGQDLGSALSAYGLSTAAPVAILGHMPWMHLLSPERTAQLRQLSVALLGDRLTLSTESAYPVVTWQRRGETGPPITILFNAGFDPATVRLTDPAGKATTLALHTPGVTQTAPETIALPAWSVAILTRS